MSIYERKQRWKLLLLIVAIMIGVSSLYYTNILVAKLSFEERKKVELWAKAMRQLVDTDTSNLKNDVTILLEVIQNNRTIPVILTDNEDNIAGSKNLDSIKSKDQSYLQKQLQIMKVQNEAILIDLGDGIKNHLYYKNSTILQQLTWYPYIQLGVILIFIAISYFAFSSSRKAEQNKVWVGLTKETAHQLGTPTSSLLGWIEVLKSRGQDQQIISELSKDVHRLEIITERFSKVGAKPKLTSSNVLQAIRKTVEYLKSRSSLKVNFILNLPQKEILIPINTSLFEWVIENICKNAIDAIEGSGQIEIKVSDTKRWVIIDISDSGKGISKSKFKTIFKPGFTTKERGWGLGLSLAKRIIEIYHKGKLFVERSELKKGTTFRIMLRNQQ
jgi:C4-dicarboxylate-specific signal transduction histidine kinase